MSWEETINDRRRSERVKIDLKVFWEGSLTQLTGNIVDLSIGGCFILSDDRVRIGELIRVEIQHPRQGVLYIWGEVVYKISEMGFAINFTGADDNAVKQLSWLVKAELYEAKSSRPTTN